MINKNYIIILDSNVLGPYKKGKTAPTNYNYFSIKKEIFFSLIKFIKDNSLTENIKVAIPRIVLEELKHQQIRSYDSQRSKLEKIFSKYSEIPDFELKTPELDYENHLDQKIDAFTSRYNIIKIDIPSENILPKLISKCLNRDKPFYKKGSEVDTGFKDAIMWESILVYAEKNKDPEYFLYTKDDDFKDLKLLTEFNQLVGKEIKIINTLSDLKTLIDDKVELNLDFSLLQRSYTQESRGVVYAILKNNYSIIQIDNDYFRVVDFRISDRFFDINRVADGKYELSIEIKVIHETPYTGYSVVDEIYAYYETDTSHGIVVLTIEKNEEDEFYLTGIDFENIKLSGDEFIGKIRLN